MIMFAGHAIVDLESWHSWWPWIPIRLTWDNMQGCKSWKVRWLYMVERRCVYSTGRNLPSMWIRNEFRDIEAVPYFETMLRDREQFA